MKRILLTLIVLVVVAAVAWLIALRLAAPSPEERFADDLFSADAQRQQAALEFWSAPGTIASPAPSPRFFSELSPRPDIRNRLLHAEPAIFMPIAETFAANPQWVAQMPWVQYRLLDLRLGEDESLGTATLEGLREITERVPREFVLDLLHRLAANRDADVRIASAELAVLTLGSDAEALVASLLADDEPMVARRAWLLLAMLDPVSGYTARWQEAPAPIAEAMLFATAWTNPEQAEALAGVAGSELEGVLPYLQAVRQRHLATASDRAELDRILMVLPADDPDQFATRASSGTMPAWWITRTMEIFAPADLASCIDALLRHEDPRARRMGVFASGCYMLDSAQIESVRRETDDAVTRAYCDAGMLMFDPRGVGLRDVRARQMLQRAAPEEGFRVDDAIFAALASGAMETGLDAALAPFSTRWRHGDEPLRMTSCRLIVTRFVEGAPLVTATAGDARTERLELEALRAWWIAHRGRFVFDEALRRYTLETPEAE